MLDIKDVDSHALTGVALTVSGFACPATALLETAITTVFTGGELSPAVPSTASRGRLN